MMLTSLCAVLMSQKMVKLVNQPCFNNLISCLAILMEVFLVLESNQRAFHGISPSLLCDLVLNQITTCLSAFYDHHKVS